MSALAALVPFVDPDPVAILFSGVTTNLGTEVPAIVTGVVGIAALAFTIKAVWVGWRAASKAVGKTGA